MLRHAMQARNLDFGLFLGWDQENRTWTLAELLRPLLFNARMMKGGKVMYNATVYAGFVGLLTGKMAPSWYTWSCSSRPGG